MRNPFPSDSRIVHQLWALGESARYRTGGSLVRCPPWARETQRMDPMTGFDALAHRSVSLLFAGLFLSIASTAGFADERCAQLVALKKQYAGVVLTSEQKELRVQLVSWYNANCGRSRGRLVNR